MRKIFIDLGAGSGGDIQGYYSFSSDNLNDEIYAFEANPIRTKELAKKYPNINIFTAAAGIHDGIAKMYLGNTLNTSSLNEKKKSVNVNNYIEVQVIDICKWMKDNFTVDDYITMVMDIEGSEYEILPEMKNQGLWEWINEFYVEFHGNKIEGLDPSTEEELTSRLIEHFNDRVYIFRKHQHEQFLKLNPEGS